jgi:hypothetical protein
MAERVRTARAAAIAAAATLALCVACADEARKRDSELTRLLEWLPGSYDNAEQAASDVAHGVRPAHEHVALTIVKVYTPRLGHHVQFAQETAADDPLRVLSERMFSFKVDDKQGILASVYSFVEPLRWRNGQEHLELFTSVLPDDVHSVPGCELHWKKAGEKFTATQDPKTCATGGGGGTAPGEPAAELSADSLVLADYRFRKVR